MAWSLLVLLLRCLIIFSSQLLSTHWTIFVPLCLICQYNSSVVSLSVLASLVHPRYYSPLVDKMLVVYLASCHSSSVYGILLVCQVDCCLQIVVIPPLSLTVTVPLSFIQLIVVQSAYRFPQMSWLDSMLFQQRCK